MARRPIIATLAFAAMTAAASAQSLKSVRARAAENDVLQAETAFTNSVCNMSISSRIDWAASADWPSARSLAKACGSALSAVETACRDGVSVKMSRFVCAGDASGAQLNGGILRYGADPNDDGYDLILQLLMAQ